MARALPSAGGRWLGLALGPADRAVLRLAFAATFAFAIAALRDWEFSFLAPMLAAQFVAGLPGCPSFRQGAAIPLTILLSNVAALAVSTFLADRHLLMLGVVGIVICWSFYLQRRGAPGILMLMIQIAFCCLPLMSTISFDLADQFAHYLFWSSVVAMGTVWLSYLVLPAPPRPPGAPPPASPPPGLDPGRSAWIAMSDTLVLIPLLSTFIAGGNVNNIVIVMITINLVGQTETAGSIRMAGALLAANLLGGVLAVLAHQFILMTDSLILFLMTIFVTGLWLGGRMVRGGPAAGVYALAFATFILVLGIALTPLPGGSEEVFTTRILKVGLASLYAIGVLTLVGWLRERDDRA